MRIGQARGGAWWVLLALLLVGGRLAADERLKRYEFSQVEMGVPFKIVLYAADEALAKRATEAAFARVTELNRILSDYDERSELSRLSAGSPQAAPVAVSKPLWCVLERAQALAAESDGAFDVTVGPLVRLWRRARREHELPTPERLAAALDCVGYRNLELDPARRAVRLAKGHMRLDVGGIGVGYAVDEALAVLKAHGIERAMIDASGDIGAADPPPDAEGWSIGLVGADPAAAPTEFLTLANAAVANSGDAFQHVEIDGVRYSHIVDPHTGLGLVDRSSVTVYAADCITADSLSTAISVLGPQRGSELAGKHRAAVRIVRQPADKVLVDESPSWQRLKQTKVKTKNAVPR